MSTAVKKNYTRPLDIKHGRIDMGHGAGGKAGAQLIEELFLPALDNPFLRQGDDGAALPLPAFDPAGGRLVMATDGHVISPLFFPGGDIGCLAVHGTVNDVAMRGGRPLYLTAGFVLEEGLALADLARIDASGLHPLVRQTEILVACDVDNPLCGPRGASAIFGPQKGATPEMVQQSLGASYGWQQAPLEVSFQNLNIDIKAGSMSKPNKFQEREQWMQLMPVLQQSMQQIAQMKQMGMTDMAKCVFEITKELVVRFDERIDLEQFLPSIEADPVQQMAEMMGGQTQQVPNAPLGGEAQAAPPELMSALQGQ